MQKKEPGTPNNRIRETVNTFTMQLCTHHLFRVESHLTLAKDTRSGFKLYLSDPNIVPSLPNAQITLTLTVDEKTKFSQRITNDDLSH